MAKRSYTHQEREQKVEAIDADMAQGLSCTAACVKNGITHPMYKRWRAAITGEELPPSYGGIKAKPQPFVQQIPLTPQPEPKAETKLVCVIGTPEDIANVLNKMKG